MTEEVRAELEKKKEDLQMFCLTHKIPLFMIAADAKGSKTEYINLCVSPQIVGVELKDDKITKYCASLNKAFELRFKSFAATEDKIESAFDALLEED